MKATKENVIEIVLVKISLRYPHGIDVDEITSWTNDDFEEIHTAGKGGIRCERFGGQGQIASRCVTLEPQKGKGKGSKRKDGKCGMGWKKQGKQRMARLLQLL